MYVLYDMYFDVMNDLFLLVVMCDLKLCVVIVSVNVFCVFLYVCM